MNLKDQIIFYPQSSTLYFINYILFIDRAFFIFSLIFHLKDSTILYLESRQHLSTYLPSHGLQQPLKTVSKSWCEPLFPNQCFTQPRGHMWRCLQGQGKWAVTSVEPWVPTLSGRTALLLPISYVGLPICFYVILFLSEVSFA